MRIKGEEMYTLKKKLPKSYIVGLLAVFVLFLLFGRQVQTHITMEYAYDLSGDAFVTVWRGNELLDECEMQDAKAELYFEGTEFTQLSPIHYDSYEEMYLRRIGIKMQGVQVMTLTPEKIERYFSPNQDILRMQEEADGLNIITGGEHPAFVPSAELLAELSRAAALASLWNLLLMVAFYTAIYRYFFCVLDLRKNHGYGDMLDAVLGLVGIAVLLISWDIAFSSAYGGTVHPDEMQTRAAVDYYRTHWIQPDVRSDFVAQTVSGYGMTRLSEINLYYLFAGKLANIVDIRMSFRALGMLMILILACFVLENVKKERWLSVMFFLTPQLWYLFSYATSDAWDYMITVLAVYEVLGERSALNRIFREKFTGKKILPYLGVGFLFANLLMAKKTFYLVLLLIFLLLLYRLIFAEKEQRRKLFVNYAALLGIALMIVLARYLPDFGYYGTHKADAVADVIETTALPEYKPSTPAAEQAKSTLLYAKGVTLREFFTDWQFNGSLFKNYFGCYGIYSLVAKDWYYMLMGALYAALFLTVGVCFHRSCRRMAADGKRTAVCEMRLKYLTMWALMMLMYLMTIYNAYFVDFQPQGRYLFPALPALACQLALDREIAENSIVRTLITAIALVSLYSFCKIAYLNF